MSLFNVPHDILFRPPNPSTYTPDDTLPKELIWIPEKETFYSIPCLFYECKESPYLLIYSHGNSCDLGIMSYTCKEIREQCNVNVIVYDYPGYGLYPGVPTNNNINYTLNCVWNYVTQDLKWPTSNIILYGQSIGSGPTCNKVRELCDAKIDLGGVILQSPFSSIKEATKSKTLTIISWLVKELWPNIDNIRNINYPILFVHGKLDDMIPHSHTENLYKECKSEKKVVKYFEYAGHNIYSDQIIANVNDFINKYIKVDKSAKLVVYTIDKKLYEIPESAYFSIMCLKEKS